MGLTSDELAEYARALESHAAVRVDIGVLDLDRNPVSTLDATGVRGAVYVDRHAPVSRLLRLQLSDPGHAYEFDANTPNEAGLFFNTLVQVRQSVLVPALDRWVTAVPFTGPITAFARDTETIMLEGHGMEALALDPLGQTLTIPAGTTKTDAIQLILAATGETQFAIPDLPDLLPRTVSLVRSDIAWDQATLIAESMALQLYARGDGIPALRPLPETPQWTAPVVNGPWTEQRLPPRVGEGSMIRTRFANRVEISNGLPSTGIGRVSTVVEPDADDALSPDSLGRNGTRRTITTVVTNPYLNNEDDAIALGQQVLADRLGDASRDRADVLASYHLEEGDLLNLAVRAEDGDDVRPRRLDKFVIPVGTTGEHVMPVGYHRQLIGAHQ